VVTAVHTSSVDVELDQSGRVLRGLTDGPTHIQCFSSTKFVARTDGDGYDLRPTRRRELRKILGAEQVSNVQRVLVFSPCRGRSSRTNTNPTCLRRSLATTTPA